MKTFVATLAATFGKFGLLFMPTSGHSGPQRRQHQCTPLPTSFFILHRLYLFHSLVSFELLSLETFIFIFLSHRLNFRFCVFFDNLKFILRLMIPLYPAVQDQQEREEKTFSTFDDFYSGKRHHSILTRLRSAIRLKCSDDGAGSKLQSHFKFSSAWKILCTWVLSFLTDLIFRNASLNAAS